MEHIKCILCDKDDSRLLVTKNRFRVVQCNGCELVYINPRPDEGELAELYNIDEDSGLEKITISQKNEGHDEHKIKKFNLAIQLLKRHKNGRGHLLDYGCATGIFLDIATNEGWHAHGVDVSRHLVEENRKRFGDRIKLQSGRALDFADKFFDVVTLFDVIEHMPNPLSTLTEVHRILKGDGALIISTPNIDGIFPKITYALFGKTFGAWEHPTPPGHVFQFSKKTLKKTLARAGFEWLGSQNFEIYRPYTVGSLENALVEALRKKTVNSGSQLKKKNRNGDKVFLQKQSQNQKLSFVKKIPRLAVRGFCWIFAATFYPLARLTGRGDSIIVVVKKRHPE